MLRALRILVSTVRAATHSRTDLLLEAVALRQQLNSTDDGSGPKYDRAAKPRFDKSSGSWGDGRLG